MAQQEGRRGSTSVEGEAAEAPSWPETSLHTWLNRDNGSCSLSPVSSLTGTALSP